MGFLRSSSVQGESAEELAAQRNWHLALSYGSTVLTMNVERPPNKDTSPPLSFLQKVSGKVDGAISSYFYNHGVGISRRPYVTIFSTLGVAVVLGLCFFLLLEQELDGEDLYTPDNAESFDDRDYLQSTYGDPDLQTRVLVAKKGVSDGEEDCDARNLLRNQKEAKANLLAFLSLHEAIEKQQIEKDGKTYTLADLCIQPIPGVCKVESILDAWNYSREALEDDPDVLATIKGENITNAFGLPLNLGFALGNNRGGPCEGNTEVFQISYDLRNEKREVNGLTTDPETAEWNEKLIDTVTDDWVNDQELEGFISNIAAIDKESEEAINRDVALLSNGYILIVVYSHFVLFKNSPVFCKAHLATFSIISIGMAIISSFGLAQIFQVKFNLVVQTLPFLLLGLGMDDTFVIMGAYHNTDPFLPLEERIGQTMARAGSSILVTSVTDCVAFVMGTYTDLPALRAFSIYAALGIMCDFIFQVTFFVAFVVLDARREGRARDGAPRWGLEWCCGKSSSEPATQTTPPPAQDVERAGVTVTEKVLSATNPPASNGKNWKRKICGSGDYEPLAPSFATKLVGEWMPEVTLHPVGKYVFLLIEAGLLAGAIYGCTKVKMDFQFRDWFTPDDSFLKDGFRIEDDYFNGDQQPFSVYTREAVDGSPYFDHQDDLVDLVEGIRENRFVADVPPTRSWYEDFSAWLPASEYKDELVGNRAPNATAFADWVKEFVNSPEGLFYKDHVQFTVDGMINGSRIDSFTVDIPDGEFAVDMVDSVRDTAKDTAGILDPIAYSEVFLFYDGFKVIAWETIRNVLMAGVAVFIISTIVLASLPASLMVTAMIALTDIMLFGFMWYADLAFNSVSAINMVLAIGIAVDYSAHVAHSFMVVKGTSQERAQKALHHIGGEVLSGAFTTWLAIIIMAFAQHYIFQTFFKMFFAIVVVGAWHGLIILPIMLSIAGPAPYPTAE